jgi:predicted permease
MSLSKKWCYTQIITVLDNTILLMYSTVVLFIHYKIVEKIFKKSANQKQELSVVAMFVNGSGRNEQSL